MKKKAGWFPVYRDMLDEWSWMDEGTSHRKEAWMDLMAMASFGEHKADVNGRTVNLKVGEIGTTKESLATRWKWSTTKVTHFLQQLSEHGMIRVKTGNRYTIIEILGYAGLLGSGKQKKKSRKKAPGKDSRPEKSENTVRQEKPREETEEENSGEEDGWLYLTIP